MIITNNPLDIFAFCVFLINFILITTVIKPIENTKLPEEHGMVRDNKIFPYMAAILKKSKYLSAGALIDDSWILTGADPLFTIRESSRFLRVRLGSVNYKRGGYLTPIKYFQIHPYFDDRKPLFDVALIKLPEPVRLSHYLNPIGLQKNFRKTPASHFIVTAWPLYQQRNQTISRYESIERMTQHRTLTVSHLQPTDPDVCSEEIDVFISDQNFTESIMCLDSNIGTDPCQRYVGAPVVLNGILWGVISSWKSEDCDVEGGISFVTLVSAVEVNSWIHSTIRGHRWTKKHTVDYVDNFI